MKIIFRNCIIFVRVPFFNMTRLFFFSLEKVAHLCEWSFPNKHLPSVVMESLLLVPSSSANPLQLFLSHPPTKRSLFLILKTTHERAAVMQMTTAASATKEAKLWGGRFEESVTETVEKFTESISFDKALYKHDIMGSRAHASMLARQVFVIILISYIHSSASWNWNYFC